MKTKTPEKKPRLTPKPKPRLTPKAKPKDREALPMVSHNGIILFAQAGQHYANTWKN